MPYHIDSKNHTGCPPSKPFAVVKDSDSTVMGCHETEEQAKAQLAALYINEPAAKGE